MNLPRRRSLLLAAAAGVLLAAAKTVSAQTLAQTLAQAYPARPVRIIVGFPAGGQIDIIARLTAQRLSERLGQQFFVDNRPGAASNIATEAALRAPPDGYTLFLANGTNAVNATLFDKLNFDFVRDTAPVASINRIPIVLAVHPSFPPKSVGELISYAKANPGKLNLATPPKGTAPYMAAELFKASTGTDIVLVAYRGDAPAVTDVLGGQVPGAFGGISSWVEQIRTGKLRALAIAGGARLEMLPDIPIIGETVPGYEASGWAGIVVPRGTPPEIVDKLSQEINAALADPTFKARLGDVGVIAFASSPEDFARHIADETRKWGQLIRTANIKPE